MAFICEKELLEIYEQIQSDLKEGGLDSKIVLVRDYLLKATIIEGETRLGKLIIDYSPKKKTHSYRKDTDLSEALYNRVISILTGQMDMGGSSFIPDSKDLEKIPDSKKETSVTSNMASPVLGSSTAYQAWVDGSFIDSCIGYGAVILKEGQVVEEIFGRVEDPEAFASRQVGGEIQAVIETLEWCKKNTVSDITIFYDFQNIERWATGQYKTNTPMTKAYKQYIDQSPIHIIWNKVPSHIGLALNDRADELAKRGAKAAKPDMAVQYAWLVYNGNMASSKFTEQVEWLIKAARENGINLDAIRNDDLLACVIENKTEVDGKPSLEKPQFVLFWDKDVRLAKQLEKMGFRLFNQADTIAVCDDKTLTHQVLSNNGIKMPTTVYAPLVFPGCAYDDDRFIAHIEKLLCYPMVVKEAFGSFGAQVYRAKNREELLAIRQKLVYKPHLYQEFVHTSYGRDVRLQVVGEKVVAAMMRVSESDFRANISAGGRMLPFDPPQVFVEMALKAARLVKADFAGVDILFGEKECPILCEINSNAHMKNIYEITGVDVADLIIKHIKMQREK